MDVTGKGLQGLNKANFELRNSKERNHLNKWLSKLRSFCLRKRNQKDFIKDTKKVIKKNEVFKKLCHTALAVHLHVLQDKLKDFGFGDTSSLFSLFPLTCSHVIDLEQYSQLTLRLDMVEEACGVFKALDDVSVVTEMICSFCQKATKPPTIHRIILATGAVIRTRKLTSGHPLVIKLISLAKEFLGQTEMSKHWKIKTVMQLTGLALIDEKFSKENQEMMVKMEERSFFGITETENISEKISLLLFNTVAAEGLEKYAIFRELLELLNRWIVGEDGCEVQRDFIIEEGMTDNEIKEIGGLAEITYSILKQFEAVDDGECFEALNALCFAWKQYKPKESVADYSGIFLSFDEICDVLENSKPRHKKEWLKKIFEFDIKMLHSKRALRLYKTAILPLTSAEDFCIFLTKVMCKKIPKELSSLILDCIRNNPAVREKRVDLVNWIFFKGTSSVMKLESFETQLRSLGVKLGSVETESDPEKQEEWLDEIFEVCFQSPLEAITSLVEQSLKTKSSKIFSLASPFFEIKGIKGDDKKKTIRILSFEKNLESLSTFDPAFSSFFESLEYLMEQKVVLTPIQSLDIISHTLNQALLTPEISITTKTVKLFEKFNNLWRGDPILEPGLDKCVEAIERIIIKTCYELDGDCFTEVMELRDLCLSLTVLNLPQQPFEVTIDENNLLDIGFLFIRDKGFREKFRSKIQHQDFHPKPVSTSTLIRNSIIWLCNSATSQWPDFYDICDLSFVTFTPADPSPTALLHNFCQIILEASFKMSALYEQYFSHCLKAFRQYIQRLSSLHSLDLSMHIEIVESILKIFSLIRFLNDEDENIKNCSPCNSCYHELLMICLESCKAINETCKTPTMSFPQKSRLLDMLTVAPREMQRTSSLFKACYKLIETIVTKRLLDNDNDNQQNSSPPPNDQPLLPNIANLSLDA